MQKICFTFQKFWKRITQGLQIDKLNERNCEEFLWVIAEQAKQHQVQYKQFTNMTHACWCSLAGVCRLLIRMRSLGSYDGSMSDARDNQVFLISTFCPWCATVVAGPWSLVPSKRIAHVWVQCSMFDWLMQNQYPL